MACSDWSLWSTARSASCRNVAAFTTYWLVRLDSASSLAADRSAATLTVFIAAAAALALVGRPFTWWRTGLVGAMVAAFALDFGDPINDLVGGVAALALLLVLRTFAAR
jgi:hypothetical protein